MRTEDLIRSYTAMLADGLWRNVNTNYSSISFELIAEGHVEVKFIFSRFGEDEKECAPQITGVFDEWGLLDMEVPLVVSVRVKRGANFVYLRFRMKSWSTIERNEWRVHSDYIIRTVDRYSVGLPIEHDSSVEVELYMSEDPLEHLVYVREKYLH